MKRISQSGYYTLTRRLFLAALRRNLLLCAALALSTLLLLLGSVNQASCTLAYESLVLRADIRSVFLSALALWAVLETARIYSDGFRNGGIYTLMMLPLPRRHVYLAYCSAGVVSVLMLWTAQTLALMASFPAVAASCQNAAASFAQSNSEALPFVMTRTNGLFLAVLRSDLFHILLPQSVPEALSSALAVLALGCVPAQLLMGGLRRIKTVLTVIASLAIVLWSLGSRFDILQMGMDTTTFVAGTALTALVLAASAGLGVRRFNKDACLTGW